MAGTLNTPDVLTQPIANNGTKNSIPNTNDQSLGLMSQSTGFPAICSERIADGGKAPKRADFNGAFNLLSQQHFFLQNGGQYTFRQDVSDAIGGYPQGAMLFYTDSNDNVKIVRSKKQNNTANFVTTPSYIDDGTNWETVVPTVSWAESTFVHIAGAETITGAKTFDVGGTNITITRGSTTFTEIQTALGNGTRSGGFRNISQNGNTTLMYVANGSTFRGSVGVVDDGTNVYGTAPAPAASNSTAETKIATTGWVNDATKSTNVVHRDSAEIITGLKTISRDDSRVSYIQSSIIDRTVTPSANQHLYFDFVDKNDLRLGVIGMRKASTGDYGVYMQAGNIGGLEMLTNGTNAWATAPASDVNGSVLTTLNKTKAQNGYFKLGNGLIIQWGLDTFNNTSTTINLPTAFTSSNYSVAFAPRDTSPTYAVGAIVESQTTASFQAHGWNVQGPRTTMAYWIAIGY